MIRIEEFIKMINWEQELLAKQLAGLSHTDSLIQPQPGGNCLNWVLGHLVVNLMDILSVLGEAPRGDYPGVDRYKIGSEPIRGEEEKVLPLEVLEDAYTRLSEEIVDCLSRMTEEAFDTEIEFWQGKSRRGYVAFFYFFHNTYHLGQLENLRNLAGKTEKVI